MNQSQETQEVSLQYSKEQLFQLKGELTYNIEVLNARLIETNKQLAALLQKEASDGKADGNSKLGSGK